jgi:hypothetical protein
MYKGREEHKGLEKMKRTIEPRDLYKACAKTTNNQTKMITNLNNVKRYALMRKRYRL